MTDPERTEDVAAAMAELERLRLLSTDQRPPAQEVRPLPIGRGQPDTQPATVADSLLLLAFVPLR